MKWNDATAPETISIQKNFIRVGNRQEWDGKYNVVQYDLVVFQGSLGACSDFIARAVS